SDGTVERGYGFSPVESGTCGPGHVVRDEHLAYRSPAYIRTMEITEVQYEALLTYGESALNKDERHFNLQYAGATNSCIDFTWGALNRAGLHREIQLPFGIKLHDKDYDGALKPLDNIREFRRIPDPVPGSPLNREQENELPERKLWQRLISVEEPQRGPSGVVTQEGRVTGPATPFTDPVLFRRRYSRGPRHRSGDAVHRPGPRAAVCRAAGQGWRSPGPDRTAVQPLRRGDAPCGTGRTATRRPAGQRAGRAAPGRRAGPDVTGR